MDRLDERYDKVKVPESLAKGQFTRKEGQRGVALGLEISAC